MSLFVKAVRTDRELREAACLVHERFTRKGFFEVARPLQNTLQDLASSSLTLIGVNEKGSVQNTVSLVAPRDFSGCHMSEIFSPELEELRWRGSLVEVWRFASRTSSSCWDTLRLMRAVVREASCLKRDIIVAAAHPEFEEFYTRTLGFQQLADGEVRHYQDVSGNPAKGFYGFVRTLACHRLMAAV